MPSGKVHDFLAYTSTVGVTYCLWHYQITNDLNCIAIFALSSLFSGLMFGPDLDTRSVQYKRWGPLKFLWLPYQAFGHRSKRIQSHDALFGPIVRIIYFFFAIIVLAVFLAGVFSVFDKKLSLSFLLNLASFILQIPLKYQSSFLSGLWFGNIVHYFADWVWEFIPKRLKA